MIKVENKVVLGILCILISGFGFALMSLFVKLSGNLPAMQKGFFRNLIAVIISAIPFFKHRSLIKMPQNKKQWWILLIRAVFGTLGLVANFYAISNINLADASIIQKLSPFIILILSYFIFKEKMNKFQIFSVILAFIGVLFIIKPSFSGLITKGSAAALLAALCTGIAYTCVRYLGVKKISGEFIIFFFSFFSCLALAPFLIFDYKPMTLYQLTMLFLAGCSATIGQYGVTFAYRFAPAKNIAAFDYAQVLFAGLLGFIFFSEIPDFYSLIGYFTVIVVGVSLAFKSK